MKKIKLISYYLLFLWGCTKENSDEKLEYYDNKKIKSIIEYSDSNKHGKSIEYFENGNVKCISNWQNGKLNGEVKYFDEKGKIVAIVFYKNGIKDGLCTDFFISNGNVRTKANYKNNLINGSSIQYFENDSGKVMAVINYINFQGQQKEMGSIWYDNLGNQIKEIRRVNLEAKKDTIQNFENLELNLELRKPLFDSTVFIIGDFTDDFFVLDSTKFDTLKATNHKVNLILKPQKSGVNYIRGFAKNWRLISKNKKETLIEEALPIYFEYKYWVN